VTDCRIKPRPWRKFRSREEGLKQKKELYLYKRAKKREQLEEQPSTNIQVLQALHVKERMLEIQSVILGKLAAEENHLKGFAEVPGLAVSNIDERVKEVGEALTMLKY
jgi:hypothetical protein